ncbi:unnamed protein product [Rangifer tarandus platyrhynchus]|uniref:G-protein coupled receptors family 1 profile domain-containing protein n=3 Tax=Rangifer tarandus platyrhynchus TaxID=3082113 RepID=A0ABN8YH48_RANTA|nr:unnamed protein product [Rangifer tarandus platyrhynchus]CAI9698919.1 unnamed protein product [Rangifer tarandus platyrhynchus]
MLADLLSPRRTKALAECLTQSFFYFSLGSTDFLLLTVMAFDRSMAICCPLHYPTIMNRPVCVKLVVVCRVVGFLSIISPTLQKTQLWFCVPSVTDHHICDSAPLLKRSCSDTQHTRLMDFFLSLFQRPDKGPSAQLNKVVALMTALVTPFLNPFIFTFRNEKVQKDPIRDGSWDPRLGQLLQQKHHSHLGCPLLPPDPQTS